jgi:hypothetical protein
MKLRILDLDEMRWSHMRVGPICQRGDLEDSPLLLSITLDLFAKVDF